MALFQQLTCVLPILDNLLKTNIINKQEHDIIKQKTQVPLQARELIDTVLVKGNAAANIFKSCLKEIDSTLYKNLFGEFFIKIILEILGIMFIFVFDNKINLISKVYNLTCSKKLESFIFYCPSSITKCFLIIYISRISFVQ